MTQTKEKKHFSRRRLYSLLVTLAGIIGSVICVGGFMYNILSQAIITDEEFMYSSSQFYILNECEYRLQPDFKRDINPEKEAQVPSEEEIEDCKVRQRENILLKRKVEYKENLLRFGSRGILFVILLSTHLPMFLRSTKE